MNNLIYGVLFIGIVFVFTLYLLSNADYSIDIDFTDEEKEKVTNDFKEGLRNVRRKDWDFKCGT